MSTVSGPNTSNKTNSGTKNAPNQTKSLTQPNPASPINTSDKNEPLLQRRSASLSPDAPGPKIGQNTSKTKINSATTKTTKNALSSRAAEAKACMANITYQIGQSRNLKTEIKNALTNSANRLYALFKESEEESNNDRGGVVRKPESPTISDTITVTSREPETELIKKLQEHSKMLENNKQEMQKLTEEIKKQREEWQEQRTYASVLANRPHNQARRTESVMHSVVITSADEKDTGEQVYEKIKKDHKRERRRNQNR